MVYSNHTYYVLYVYNIIYIYAYTSTYIYIYIIWINEHSKEWVMIFILWNRSPGDHQVWIPGHCLHFISFHFTSFHFISFIFRIVSFHSCHLFVYFISCIVFFAFHFIYHSFQHLHPPLSLFIKNPPSQDHQVTWILLPATKSPRCPPSGNCCASSNMSQGIPGSFAGGGHPFFLAAGGGHPTLKYRQKK